MGYMTPCMDEIDESKMLAELHRRHKLREAGKCDYCERYRSDAVCKFPDRHAKASERTKVREE